MADRAGQQIGSYRLVKLLGSGGFAEVYLAQHVRLASKQAAIKILHLIDIDARKFQEEAETTEQLVHPHIVRLLDFDIEQGTPFLVLEYAPSGSLRTRHPKGSSVPLARVGEYLKEIAPALQYAHDQHILHRDIKPDNMLIGRQGELLLSDFGIAVLTQTGRTSFSSTYDIGGTPFYMAPETYRGRPEKASDQYALAVVVYEWLCGSVPFSEGNFIQLGYQHAHEPVPSLREKNPVIPPEVEAVVMKALAKESKQRFEHIQAFAATFEQACIPPSQPVGTITVQVPFQEGVVTQQSQSGDTLSVRTTPIVPVSMGTHAPPQPVTASRRITRREMLIRLSLAGAGLTATGIIGWLELTHRSPSSPYTYRGHPDFVSSVAWSPDGKRIASGGGVDSTVQVWDAIDGGHSYIYRGHSSNLMSVAWSPDGKYIASGVMTVRYRCGTRPVEIISILIVGMLVR